MKTFQIGELTIVGPCTHECCKNSTALREHFIDLELLVIDMHERGELPSGLYLMKIWW